MVLDGNGGVRNCGGVALANGPDGPNGPNGQDGRARLRPDGLRRGKPRDNPRVGGAAVFFGAGRKCAAGVQQQTAARLEESAAAPTGKSVRDF